MNIAFAIAGVLALATGGIHTFLGGKEAAVPLLASKLLPVPKFTNYYTWHMVTITLFAMACGYFYGAFSPDGFEIAVLLTGLSVCYAALSFGLIITKKRRLLELPQWSLFLVISIAALFGIF